MLLRNIKYGDDVVILGELLKGKLEIIIDGSLRFTYLADAIFKAFLKIVSFHSPSFLCGLHRPRHVEALYT